MMLGEIAGVIAAAAAALETGLRHLPQKLDYDCRKADGYRADDSEWSQRYFSEWSKAQLSFRWEPFSYWRSAPREGDYINVGQDGLRRTTGSEQRDGAKVFLFGGSTMWGSGVRDTGTIASHCAELLSARGRRATVTNHGQIGYVSTQSVIALLRLLQRGEVPDLVIFYDGYNDVLSATVNGAAGMAYQEARRGAEFNILHRSADLCRAAIRSTRIWQLAAGRKRPAARPSWDENELAKDIAERYLANIAAVKALGSAFGFQTRFYWQPTIFHKPSLTAFERTQQDSIAMFEGLFALVEGRLLGADGGPFMLSRLFEGTQRPIFIDWAHLTESANRQVAEILAADAESSFDGWRDAPHPCPAGAGERQPAAVTDPATGTIP